MAPPANDDIANAAVLSGALPISTTGTIVDATLEVGETTPIYAWAARGKTITGQRTVWYNWNCTSNQAVRIAVNTNIAYVTALAVYTGSTIATLGVPVASNSEEYDGSNYSLVNFTASAGVNYFVSVNNVTATNTGGVFSLFINSVASNALFDTPQVLTGLSGTVAGSTINAVREIDEPIVDYLPGASVWYRWQATSNVSITVTLAQSSNSDGPVFNVVGYHGTKPINSLVAVFGHDKYDVFPEDQVSYSLNASSGEIYHFKVEEQDNSVYGATFSLSYLATNQNTAALPTQTFALLVNSTVSSLVSSMAPNTQVAIATGPLVINDGDLLINRMSVTNNPNFAFWKVSYSCRTTTDKQIMPGASFLNGGTGTFSNSFMSFNNTDPFLVSTPGTFSNLRIARSTLVATTRSDVIALVVNSTASILTATMSGIQLSASDLANTISVTRGDRILYRCIASGTSVGATGGFLSMCVDFTPDTVGSRMFGLEDSAFYIPMGPTYGALGRDGYDFFPTQQTLNGTDIEYPHTIVCPMSGTIKDLIVERNSSTASMGSGNSATFTMRKNGTRTALAVTLINTSISVVNTASSFTVTTGDFITLEGHDQSITETFPVMRYRVGWVFQASTNSFPLFGYTGTYRELNAATLPNRYIGLNGRVSLEVPSISNSLGTANRTYFQLFNSMTIDTMYAYVTYPPYFTSSTSTSTGTGGINNNSTWAFMAGDIFECSSAPSTTWAESCEV